MFGYAQSLIVNQQSDGLALASDGDTEAGSERGWTKAIPRSRDRAQSRALVGCASILLGVQTLQTMAVTIPEMLAFPAYAVGAMVLSAAFAVVVRWLRAGTTAAAVCGGMICLTLTYATGWLREPPWRSGLTPLVLLFALTFLATRAGRGRKERVGLAEARRGRSAAQVIANLGVAALCVSPAAEWMLRRWAGPGVVGFSDMWVMAVMRTASLAALTEATADTMSSEVGQAFGGRPVLLTGFRRVEPGTDGAVSPVGTAAGITGAAVIAAVGAWAMHLGEHGALVAFGCGVFGLFADSLLGATVERKGWLGNDLVNFGSTALAALAAMAMMRW